MTCPLSDHPTDQSTLPPCRAVWRELAQLQQENAALRAALQHYGLVCQLVGRELITRAEAACPPPADG